MDFSNLIDKVMSEVKSGSTEPFIIYHDKDGGWHCDFTQNQYGETFAWVEDIKEQDHLAVTFKGTDFASGSFPYVYDMVFTARIREEYYIARSSGRDSNELNALTAFFVDNIAEFSQETTDYLAKYDRPLATLQKINPLRLASDTYAYDEDKAQKLIELIENKIEDMRSRDNDEIKAGYSGKRNIEGYEEITSIQLAGRIIVLAENPGAENPYMVCNIRWDNPLGAEERYDGAVTNDYLEAISEFIDRQTILLGDLRDERTPGFPFQKITAAECIPNSSGADLLGKVIIIKPESLAPEYRRAEHQYVICTGGFGASPDSRGNAVYAKNLFSGKESRYERYNVAGIADPLKMPEWVKTKLAIMEALKEPGVFEYGGYHFKPVRSFGKNEVDKPLDTDSRPWKKDAQFAMRNMSSDSDLNIRNQNSNGNSDYSHEKFYAASRGSEADIFMCIENGKLYVPGANELFHYNEPTQKVKGAEKKPSLLGKLDDNKQKVERGKAERTDKPVTKRKGDLEVD
jgi:hypothetical protein